MNCFFQLTNTFHRTLQLLIITGNSNITLMSNTTLGFEICDVCVNFGPCFVHMLWKVGNTSWLTYVEKN